MGSQKKNEFKPTVRSLEFWIFRCFCVSHELKDCFIQQHSEHFSSQQPSSINFCTGIEKPRLFRQCFRYKLKKCSVFEILILNTVLLIRVRVLSAIEIPVETLLTLTMLSQKTFCKILCSKHKCTTDCEALGVVLYRKYDLSIFSALSALFCDVRQLGLQTCNIQSGQRQLFQTYSCRQ